MKRLTLICTLAISAISLLPTGVRAGSHHAARPAFPVTVVDDLKTTVRIGRQPKRIVSLDPRDTETLFALGLEKRVVGDGGQSVEGAAGFTRPFKYPSQWPSPWGRDYPIKSKALTHIEGGCCGTPWNLETIESLRPDLVVALNSDLQDIQKMRDLGLKVIVLDPANVAGIRHDIQLVGKATGASKQASTVLATMKKQLQAVKTRVARFHNRPRVYYEIDATNPTQPFTAGPGTFIDEAIRIAGGSNVADSARTCTGKDCYPQFSLEALVKLDPQIILLGDAAYGTKPADVKARSGWSTISAVQSGKVYPFDDELISRAGPRIVVGIQKMAKRLHP